MRGGNLPAFLFDKLFFMCYHVFMTVNFGYCCINLELSERGVTTNRTMREATYNERGIAYASELAYKNTLDLISIMTWNQRNNIKVFRLSSDLFPWNSKYKLEDLPDYNDIATNLKFAGDVARRAGIRVTAHPDHFVKLASDKQSVVDNAIHDLHHHNEVFSLMGFPANHYYCLNIHVGMNYSDKVITNFINNFYKLNADTQARLVVENDDKASAFSVKQLHTDIYSKIKTPITFDYFHHTFHPDSLSELDAYNLAYRTWDCRPLFHYSESKALHENIQCNPRAHSDYASTAVNTYGDSIDIDLELKAKEKALFKYVENVWTPLTNQKNIATI